MKDFITTIASIIILMIFLLQFVTNQSTYTRLAAAEHAVKEFRLTAEESGGVDDEKLRRLKEKAAAVLNCGADEIRVSVSESTEDGAESGGSSEDGGIFKRRLEYSVQMPVQGLVGAADFLGIAEEDNMTVHVSEGIIQIEEEIEEDCDEEPDNNDGNTDADGNVA